VKNRLFNIIILLVIVLQITWYAILWVSYVNSPVLLQSADFRPFYAAGRISKDLGFDKVFNLDMQTKVQDKVVGHILSKDELLIYYHPPLLLPILNFIANFNYQTAYIINCIFLLMLAFACLPFLFFTLKQFHWSISSIWIMILGFIFFEPTFISILKGQDSTLLLLGLVIWFSALLKGEDRLAGLGLALTTIRPQLSIFLAIPFIFHKRRVFTWYLLSAGLLLIYSYLMVGKQGFLDLLDLIRIGSAGQDYGLNLSAMFNLTGLILRVYPGVDHIFLNYLKWGLYGLALLGMILVWRQSSKIQNRHLAILVIFSIFFSPHLHYHDLVILLIPIIVMLLIWVEHNVISAKMAGLILFIFSIALLFGNIITKAYHTIPYLIMIFVLFGSWRPLWFRLQFKSRNG
jgi:hypothetical protein